MATGESLKRQLDLLISLRLPVLILDVSACRFLDTDGVMLILNTYRRLRETGGRFAVVAGARAAARILNVCSIDAIIPVFPTEAAATLALRGGTDLDPAVASWEEARSQSLEMWRSLHEILEVGTVEEVARRITASHGLLRRAEELFQAEIPSKGVRCHLCPLFHALGGRAKDNGCQSITGPMLEELLKGNRTMARAQIGRLIRIIEEMPLPDATSGLSVQPRDQHSPGPTCTVTLECHGTNS